MHAHANAFYAQLLDINCIDYPVYVHFGRIRSGSNYCPPIVLVLYYTRSWLDQLGFFPENHSSLTKTGQNVMQCHPLCMTFIKLCLIKGPKSKFPGRACPRTNLHMDSYLPPASLGQKAERTPDCGWWSWEVCLYWLDSATHGTYLMRTGW